MKFTDYYATLGVARDASASAVKTAYRKLARQLHPDVNKDPAAGSRFKVVNEAYEVLKDPEKRAKYDRLGAEWEELSRQEEIFRSRRAAAPAGAAGGSGFSDFFDTFFGPGGVPLDDFEEVARSTRGGPGHTFRYQRGAAHPRPQRGVDVEQDIDIALEEAVRGGVRLFAIGSRQVEVRIPAGVTHGSRVRVSGEGGEGRDGGTKGDIYLRIRLRPHPRFTIRGRDLVGEVTVRDDQAVLGDVIPVDGPLGPLQVRVPPGTQSGRTLRLRGKGLPPLRSGSPGDLLLSVRIGVPASLSEAERDLYGQLHRLRAPGSADAAGAA